jgi:hypothetical protein
MVGVQPARIRQEPDDGWSESIGLRPREGVRSTERCAIRAEPEDGDEGRLKTANLLRKRRRTGPKLVGRHVGRRRTRAGDEVRNPQPEARQLDVLRGVEAALGEVGAVKRPPEPVARPGEVMADGRRIQTRIDADEDDPEPPPEHVRNRPPGGAHEVPASWRDGRSTHSRPNAAPSVASSRTRASSPMRIVPGRSTVA